MLTRNILIFLAVWAIVVVAAAFYFIGIQLTIGEWIILLFPSLVVFFRAKRIWDKNIQPTNDPKIRKQIRWVLVVYILVGLLMIIAVSPIGLKISH